MTNFTSEKAITVLSEIINALKEPENMTKLEEAKTSAGNEMLRMMQCVFPLVMQIQIDVAKNYGFADSREGIVQFEQLIRSLEREDSEVARLHNIVRSYYLPPVSATSTTETTPYDLQITDS